MEGNPPGGGPSCTTGMSLMDCTTPEIAVTSWLTMLWMLAEAEHEVLLRSHEAEHLIASQPLTVKEILARRNNGQHDMVLNHWTSLFAPETWQVYTQAFPQPVGGGAPTFMPG